MNGKWDIVAAEARSLRKVDYDENEPYRRIYDTIKSRIDNPMNEIVLNLVLTRPQFTLRVLNTMMSQTERSLIATLW